MASRSRPARGRRGSGPARKSPRRRTAALRPALSAVRVVAAFAGILALGGAGYIVARETSIFAVREIAVSGGSPVLKAQVRQALAPELGRSLVTVGGAEIARRVNALPGVVSVHFDRSFPHTLHVTVKPERAVLLIRQRKASWVVSSRGRVMKTVSDPRRSSLPRLWLPASVPVSVGQTMPLYAGTLAAAAVAPVAPGSFHGIRTVLSTKGQLTFVLDSGAQVRLGDLGDLRLKLTVARRILAIARASGTASTGSYVDVSVPERPVLGTPNSQVAGTA